MTDAPVVVYGANGATGARCVELAVAAGLRPIVAGRNAAALAAVAEPAGLEVRVGRLDELGRVLAGAGAVVSCVAPYSRHGLPVVEAALRAGAHYVDCTGEPRYVWRLISAFDAPAQAAGSVLVPAAGIGLASNLVARTAAAGVSPVQRLTVDYLVRRMVPSWGTVSSTALILAGDVPEWRDGTVAWVRPGSRVAPVDGGRGANFPLTDVLTIARQFPDAEVQSLLRSRVAPLLGATLRGSAGAARRPGVRRGLDRAARGLDRLRPRGEFHITVTAEGGGGRHVARGIADDIYETTSRAAVEIVGQLLRGACAPGVRASGEVITDVAASATRIGLRLGR